MESAHALHMPVMAADVAQLLLAHAPRFVVDGTVGTGGHAERLLREGAADMELLGIDRDACALAVAARRLAPYGARLRLVEGNFRDLGILLAGRRCDAVLLDLGISSLQIADENRGFSYLRDGSIDMAMGADSRSVMELLAASPEEEIGRVIREYGEERRWRRIARAIVARRAAGGISRVRDLREAIEGSAPARERIATLSRVFQALRIWANEELDCLSEALPQAVDALEPRGRIAVLSYHSLEDRTVKRFFRAEERGCTCPPDFPVCRCGRVPRLRVITRRAATPAETEIAENPRARSAKLRGAERI